MCGIVKSIKKWICEIMEYNKYKLPKADKQLNIKYLESQISKIDEITPVMKREVRIIFIDDEGYNVDPIRKMGYADCHCINNYDNISDFESYDVIFCDISGVATELHPVNQGAELAKQLKETYPSKMVVIFTSKKYKIDISSYRNIVDQMISKSTSIASIIEIINDYIKNKYNPIKYWSNKEKSMRNAGVSNNIIGIVEHYYVLSILNKRDLIDDILLKYRKKFPIKESIEVIETIGSDFSNIFFRG